MLSCSALDLYSASDYLPRYLSDDKVGHSYDVQETPWQTAVGTTKPRWEWLEEQVPSKTLIDGNCGTDGGTSGYPGPYGDELKEATRDKAEDELVSRPEHKIFGLAMLGGGRVFGEAHLFGQLLQALVSRLCLHDSDIHQIILGLILEMRPLLMLVAVLVSAI